MRYLILFILPALVGFSCSGNSSEAESSESIDSTYCDCFELTFDQQYNHWWRYERRKGFTGNCDVKQANGNVDYEKNFIDGKMEGEYIVYHENGQPYKIRNYMQNFQDGDSYTYSKSGRLIAHAIYKRGHLKEMVFEDRSINIED
ncbi:MAG: hypothetical protein R2780_01610 [Crocinitomicaceae bacterium]